MNKFKSNVSEGSPSSTAAGPNKSTITTSPAPEKSAAKKKRAKKTTARTAPTEQTVLPEKANSKSTSKKTASKATASKKTSTKKTAAKVTAKKAAQSKKKAKTSAKVTEKMTEKTTKKTAAKATAKTTSKAASKTTSKAAGKAAGKVADKVADKAAEKSQSAKTGAASKAAAKKSSTSTAKPKTSKKAVSKKVSAQKASKITLDEVPDAQNDADFDDTDGDQNDLQPQMGRTVVPYERDSSGHYMNSEQLEHFSQKLADWKQQLMEEVDRTVGHMKDDATNFPDPNDRATQEEEFSLELRTRDRERKLIKKINEAQKRIDDDEYGYCETCGIEIGVNRLEARPTAELCIDCKTLEEIRERQTA